MKVGLLQEDIIEAANASSSACIYHAHPCHLAPPSRPDLVGGDENSVATVGVAPTLAATVGVSVGISVGLVVG